MKCLNIIVFYDNYEEVKNYIEDALCIGEGNVDIAIVNNKDSRNQVTRLTSELPAQYVNKITIYNYGKNIGYLNSLLKTIQKINLDDYKYIILSNTDIIYNTKDFFIKLLKNEYVDNIGCIAPSVYNPNKEAYSNPHYMTRIPISKLKFLTVVFYFPRIARLYLRLSRLKNKNFKVEKKDSCYAYSPHGCYMIFTKEFIDRIKGFEYGVILYSEESCVGELLIRNNLKCYYDNSIEVIHNESSVTGKMNYKKRFYEWRKSLLYIIKEFYDV